MKRTFIGLGLVASLFAGVGLTGAAAGPSGPARKVFTEKTGEMKVIVRGPGGKPAAGAAVEVTRSGGDGVPSRRRADGAGRVGLTGLEPGQYLVVAFSADGSDFDWRVVKVRAGDGTLVVLAPPRSGG